MPKLHKQWRHENDGATAPPCRRAKSHIFKWQWYLWGSSTGRLTQQEEKKLAQGFSNIYDCLSIINLVFNLVRNRHGVINNVNARLNVFTHKLMLGQRFLLIANNFFTPIFRPLSSVIQKQSFVDGLHCGFIKMWI